MALVPVAALDDPHNLDHLDDDLATTTTSTTTTTPPLPLSLAVAVNDNATATVNQFFSINVMDNDTLGNPVLYLCVNPGACLSLADQLSGNSLAAPRRCWRCVGTYVTGNMGHQPARSRWSSTRSWARPLLSTGHDCLADGHHQQRHRPAVAVPAPHRLLSTAERVDHPEGMAVKFGDWPLYYFAQDTAPGDLNGQGLRCGGGAPTAH